MTIKILWVSAHPMLPSQHNALHAKYGDIAVERYADHIHSASELEPYINRNDIIACVLPDGLLKHVVRYAGNSQKPVLRPVFDRKLGEFLYWLVIERYIVISRRL